VLSSHGSTGFNLYSPAVRGAAACGGHVHSLGRAAASSPLCSSSSSSAGGILAFEIALHLTSVTSGVVPSRGLNERPTRGEGDADAHAAERCERYGALLGP
jgi:hypothetical protein